jgi:NDP-sugar pyrophosphorylase family protein
VPDGQSIGQLQPSIPVMKMKNRDQSTSGKVSDITVAVLAGGLGLRLRSKIPDLPKVMAHVAGKPFLTYVLDRLIHGGFRDVVLCTGYLGESIESWFGRSYRNLNLSYSQEPSPLGTAGALRLALPLLKSDSILILNGDSLCEVDLRNFFTVHQASGLPISMILVHMQDTSRFGRIDQDATGRIRRFIEKESNNGPGWINGGVYLMRKDVIQGLPTGNPLSLETDVLAGYAATGSITGVRSWGLFIDIGTPDSLEKAAPIIRKIHADGVSS